MTQKEIDKLLQEADSALSNKEYKKADKIYYSLLRSYSGPLSQREKHLLHDRRYALFDGWYSISDQLKEIGNNAWSEEFKKEFTVFRRRMLNPIKTFDLRAIGIWRSDSLSHPTSFQDSFWEETEKQMVIKHLKNALPIIQWREVRFCQCNCGAHDEKWSFSWVTDGYYYFPQELYHYLESHHVKLPQEFIEHVRNYDNRIEQYEIGVGEIDYGWWEQQDLKFCENLLRSNPDNSSANARLGNIFRRKKEKEKAREYFDKVDISDLYSASLLRELTISYGILGMHDSALIAIKKAIAINPDNLLSHYYMGICYWILDHLEFALAAFEKAYEEDPNNIIENSFISKETIASNLGMIAFSLKKHDLALTYFQKNLTDKIATKTWNDDALIAIAFIYLVQNNQQVAINYFQESLAAYKDVLAFTKAFWKYYEVLELIDLGFEKETMEMLLQQHLSSS